VNDLSLEDAKKSRYINGWAYRALSGMTLSDGSALTLKAAYDLVTADQKVGRSILGDAFSKVSPAVTREVVAGWEEFSLQIKQPDTFDFSDMQTRYPERNIT
jgi:hypothetical protein